MRVLLVNDCPPGPTGGAEVHVGRLADALRSVGDDVDVTFPDRTRSGLASVLDVWDPASRRRLRERIDTYRPDVVHYHNVLDELSTSVVGLGPPSVLTVHDPRIVGIRFGLDDGRPGWLPIVALRDAKNRLARSRLRANVHATIAPSAELADALSAAGFPSVSAIPNFATPHALRPLGRDVVFVGALSPHKGPHVLLEAFHDVAGRHTGCTLRFVGDGPYRPVLAAQADLLGIAERVVFEGRCGEQEMVRILGSAAVVIAPSLGVEGGGPPLVVIEAMCSGRPVIVTDRPGVREGVDDTVGAIVAAGDVGALARALGALLDDRGALEARGTAALRRAHERWAPGVVVPRIRAVYAGAIDAAR